MLRSFNKNPHRWLCKMSAEYQTNLSKSRLLYLMDSKVRLHSKKDRFNPRKLIVQRQFLSSLSKKKTKKRRLFSIHLFKLISKKILGNNVLIFVKINFFYQEKYCPKSTFSQNYSFDFIRLKVEGEIPK